MERIHRTRLKEIYLNILEGDYRYSVFKKAVISQVLTHPLLAESIHCTENHLSACSVSAKWQWRRDLGNTVRTGLCVRIKNSLAPIGTRPHLSHTPTSGTSAPPSPRWIYWGHRQRGSCLLHCPAGTAPGGCDRGNTHCGELKRKQASTYCRVSCTCRHGHVKAPVCPSLPWWLMLMAFWLSKNLTISMSLP